MVYRPPQGSQKECINKIRSTLQLLPNIDNVIILGDMNIDYRQVDTSTVKDLKSLEREFSLKQYIKGTTRETCTTATVIDHIFSNATNIAEAGIIRLTLSDHFMIYILIKKQHVTYEKTTFTCRQLKNFSEEKLSMMLESVDWGVYYDLENMNECWKFIYNVFISILDELCPEKTYLNVNKRSEWISSQLFELMKTRDHMFRRAKKNPDDWDEAKKYRNTVNDAVNRPRVIT